MGAYIAGAQCYMTPALGISDEGWFMKGKSATPCPDSESDDLIILLQGSVSLHMPWVESHGLRLYTKCQDAWKSRPMWYPQFCLKGPARGGTM